MNAPNIPPPSVLQRLLDGKGCEGHHLQSDFVQPVLAFLVFRNVLAAMLFLGPVQPVSFPDGH